MAETKKTAKAAVVKTVDDLKKELAEKRHDLLKQSALTLLVN